MKENIVHKRVTPIKLRTQSCYDNKIEKLTEWYNKLIAYREKFPVITNPNTKQETKRRELKDLEYYIEKLKKPRGRQQ